MLTMNKRSVGHRGLKATAALLAPAAVALLALSIGGCTQHRVIVDPIEVKPMHITVDINLRVDRELDDFFDFEKPIEREVLPELGKPTPRQSTTPPPPPPMR